MARVNVEQKALTDPRFLIVGSHLRALNTASDDALYTAYGLYQMIRVWNYCLERGLLVVPVRDLDALHPGLSDAMCDAQLGEKVKGSRPRSVRIKGGDGLLDWLHKKRENGRNHGAKGGEHGVKGGRPPKNAKPGEGVLENPVRGFPENPPPALTLTPAPALREECPPLSGGINTANSPKELVDLWLHYRKGPGHRGIGIEELIGGFEGMVKGGYSIEELRVEIIRDGRDTSETWPAFRVRMTKLRESKPQRTAPTESDADRQTRVRRERAELQQREDERLKDGTFSPKEFLKPTV